MATCTLPRWPVSFALQTEAVHGCVYCRHPTAIFLVTRAPTLLSAVRAYYTPDLADIIHHSWMGYGLPLRVMPAAGQESPVTALKNRLQDGTRRMSVAAWCLPWR